MMQFSSDKDIVVFDLDDTLYKEIDYLISAYHAIAVAVKLDVEDEMVAWYHAGLNTFQCLIERYNVNQTLQELLDIYRYHEPNITLSVDAEDLLAKLRKDGVGVGIISDGRSKTQRNKLKALGLEWVKNIVISEEYGSEKPCESNYKYFMDKFPLYHFTYIADNPLKDFVTPNRLGWNTICLKDDGRNIHKQNFDVGKDFLPQRIISKLTD